MLCLTHLERTFFFFLWGSFFLGSNNYTIDKFMDPIPHSITRTLSRFRTELMSESSSLAIHKLEVVEYKASTSL
jgi:hypothetical protein